MAGDIESFKANTPNILRELKYYVVCYVSKSFVNLGSRGKL